MSIEQLNQAFKADIKKSSTKFILVALSDYANEVGEAYPTVQTINAKTSLNRKTIISGLSELVDLGFIKDTGKRVGRTKSIPVWQILTLTKQSQKRNQSENGTATEAVPILPPSNPQNGTAKQSQKRDIEPSVLLTTNEPPIKKIARTRFLPPSEVEINQLAQEQNLNLVGFFDYYESNGWMVGKNKMKNWKAAAKGWHNRSKQYGASNGTRSSKATSGQSESAATRAHNRNKQAYEAALVEEQGDQTLRTVPSQVHAQVDFSS